MSVSSTIAAIRFGSGLSPASAPPRDADALIAELSAPDRGVQDFPVAGSRTVGELARKIARQNKDKRAGVPGAAEARKGLQRQAYGMAASGLVALLLRGQTAPTGFRERLQDFWSDHFTVVAPGGALLALPTAFAEEAIRPNIATSFPLMLRAATTHPAMLIYLNQNTSFGPNSPAGKRRHKGLNENLGREVLELHTLGVGAPYTQTDVRQMAFLLTGLTVRADKGFVFNARMVEPMTEVVLGQGYGGPAREKLDQIHRALDDIALRPETARHICTKLATYFVADLPDKGLVEAMTAAYRKTDGALVPVYRAMLDHPAAWAPLGAKVRRPFDFVTAALRALQPPVARMRGLDFRQVNRGFARPMADMGQKFQHAAGPNGWPEAAAAWIQPQFLAARIQWTMAAPVALQPDLPDPRDFVQAALAGAAQPATRQAAMRAESRREGIGLILASNDFNRR